MSGTHAFTRALFRDWLVLASSTAFVLLLAAGQLSAAALPTWALRATAAVSLLIAAGRGWQLKNRDETRIANANRGRALASTLAGHLEPALAILNRKVEGDDDFRRLVSDHRSWVAGLLLSMTERGCTPDEIHTIKDLHRHQFRHYSDDPTTDQEKGVLLERIETLRRIVDRYNEPPKPEE